MDIVVKSEHVVNGSLYVDLGFEAHWRVPAQSGRIVSVTLSTEPKKGDSEPRVLITSYIEATASSRAAEELQAGIDLAKMPTAAAEIGPLIDLAYAAALRIAYLLKYLLENPNLSDVPIYGGNSAWRRANDGEWRWFEDAITLNVIAGNPVSKLDSWWATRLQECLDDGVEPFAAMRHLHLAEQEDRPWAKWIEATIAAELAIKEYLARKNPGLRALLTELPSPPLGKLYGPVLEAYAGFRATKRSVIDKGATLRNDLLHRFASKSISDQEAREYVADVRFTIWELLLDLYPNNAAIRASTPRP